MKLKIVRFIIAWLLCPIIVPYLYSIYFIGWIIEGDNLNFEGIWNCRPAQYYFKWMVFK